MLSDELIKKVRKIEITTRRLVNDVMTGQYRTSFKGHGVQFSEHREYMAGDDIRHIDWKVSARTRDPLIKKFEEERELTVFLVIDVSGSQGFGSQERTKNEVAAEIAGMIAYAAIQSGDKVGVLLFAGEVEKIIRPKKGRAHVLRVIREVLGHQNQSQGTRLKDAIDSAHRIMKHSGIVFIISDFLAKDYDIPLKRLSKKNDVISIWVRDPREKEIPVNARILVQDSETGKEQWVHTGTYSFKKWFKEWQTQIENNVKAIQRSGKVELWELSTGEDYAEALARFFRLRSSRR